jgi:3,5-epimerase/4-reductase
MTVLPLLLPILVRMMQDKRTGTYNFVNPGLISHNEILEMYKTKIDPTFSWKNFDITEQNTILRSRRSNNYLETTKLTSSYEVPSIKKSVEWCFDNWIN